MSMINFIPGYYSLSKTKEQFFLIFVIGVNLMIKLIPASILELGNDEVYYWTYALFPDWSHFDHPPMVGLTIQLFTLNLLFDSELFIRLGALVLSSINIVLLFYLVKKLYSQPAGFIAVLLFTSSIYFNILSGLIILPDTPQVFFIMLALYFGLPSFIKNNPDKEDLINILLFGLFTGLAFLSKYHSLFLWFGVGLYILFHNRIWLKKPAFYVSILITIVLMTPVIYWNIKNDFISFAFHGDRIGFFQSPVNWDSFVQFNLGQIFYQNPIVIMVFTLGLISFIKDKKKRSNHVDILSLYLSIPIIVLFSTLSLFKSTLPHWTGPAFIGLIIIGSDSLADLYYEDKSRVTSTLAIANLLFILAVSLGTLQINKGLIDTSQVQSDVTKVGKKDFTLDMYGWKQASEKFRQFLDKKNLLNPDSIKNTKIVSNKWFPAAHIDYYLAKPLNIDLFAIGNIEDIHKYYWINQKRDSIGDRFYFVTTSQQFHSPMNFSRYFQKIIPVDTLKITRNGIVVKNVFIYEVSEPVKFISQDWSF